jgi:hypothetical protein
MFSFLFLIKVQFLQLDQGLDRHFICGSRSGTLVFTIYSPPPLPQNITNLRNKLPPSPTKRGISGLTFAGGG